MTEGERVAILAPNTSPILEPIAGSDGRWTDRSGPYGDRVPRISFFYGISIYMYWNEAHHIRPHFHARYGGQSASIDLDGNVLAGSLARRAHTLVADWAHLHRAELEATCLLSRFPSIEPMEQLLDVTAVEVVGDFRLRLTFEDGTVGDVDFATREWRGILEPLSDATYFARVRVDPEAGTIAWPNGVDLAPEPLYEEARRNLAESASSPR